MSFKIGDRVRWSSQSSGSKTTKEGEVVAVVPHLRELGDVQDQYLCSRPSNNITPVELSGLPRKGESYLVLVRIGNRKPRLYWPRVKGLEKI